MPSGKSSLRYPVSSIFLTQRKQICPNPPTFRIDPQTAPPLSPPTKNKIPNFLFFRKLGIHQAEEEGFEPPVPLGTTVFKTAAIDHSATPLGHMRSHISVGKCKAKF